MSILTTVGLVIDLVGAVVILAADFPDLRDEFAYYSPRLSHVERLKRDLKSRRPSGVKISPEHKAYSDLIDILEEKNLEPIDGEIVFGNIGLSRFVVHATRKTDQHRLATEDIQTWIENWTEKHIRRLGLSFLVIGFLSQLIDSVLV
ncbi:hypothetical protein E4P24_02805 [Haloferax sp. AS1]|uniref:hypothetical protein n=1 Tax=Haloferax sp. AS1 TaxID=2562277 RepID=UPI00165F6616|nr:hypothetical protein [Haloferax sp. AS1]MBC9985301.1 hypothetical protein [Haloferax sp. AS1]